MMPAKKYKLHSTSTSEPGAKPICAFFTSEAGCRNGANCKFSHGDGGSSIQAPHREMVVSSESSESESESPFVTKKELVKNSKAPTQNIKQEDEANGREDLASSEHEQVKIETSYASLANPNRKRKVVEARTKSNTKSPKPKVPKCAADDDLREVDVPSPANSGGQKTKNTSFRLKMDLPIAPFKSPVASVDTLSEANLQNKATPKKEKEPKRPDLPLPTSTNTGREWSDVVKRTQSHRRFATDYNFEKFRELDEAIGYASNAWVKTTPFAKDKAHHPQVIAIDCEMCETHDPVSGKKDHRSLCRFSVVDAEADEVLLDTLVKPMWPVSDHRDWVNGITADDLAKVQFTLRHAQAFMIELCSEETVIVGHAVHNDLAALRIEHYVVADSAALFKARDSDTATVALRDLATTILKSKMPTTHDSVNDARVALACVDHFRQNDGNVEDVVRTPRPQMVGGREQGNDPDRNCSQQLFVHRIPKNKCKESDLATMFLEHTNIKPENVDEIEFNQNGTGRTHIHFSSASHAGLAFQTLQGKAELEKSGRLQKNVYLRNGNYIRVRMMTSEPDSSSQTNI